ncbi:MAG: 23S rRNA (uracil(1939)-C(5))-methyltransferase RlmD [Desulfobacterales bacterium]|nr:23S rRNA (uracil(1939)-C(5))-methyltransferase RlmD [Desulfobacterales bacterium]
MAVKKGQELELEITGIAFGGKGIAKVDGFTIFVDKAVPGDRVIARIGKKKKSYAEARIFSIIEASPDRIKAPCLYSGLCGGCKWQFLDYAKQLEYKRMHVEESLDHIGGIKDVKVHPVIPSDRVFEYRNKMEFSCAEKRWLLPEELGREGIEAGFALGLHVPGTFFKVLDIDVCHLQKPQGNDILRDVREYMRKSDKPIYGLRSNEGFWRFLMIRHSTAHDQWMVNIITSENCPAEVQPLAEMLKKKHPNIVSIVNNVTSRKSSVAVGEFEVQLLGEPYLKDKIGAFEFNISANSFFQTNTPGAENLYRTAKDYAGLKGDETVVDLYCGTGTIAIFLSDSVKEVTGFELVGSAIRDAENNCRLNGIENCKFIPGDIKDSLFNVRKKPDVMIIDPPRSGMHRDVVKQILDIAPERIVYVSCNPATMARDLEMMKDHYDILEVQPVDMFPHTYHIESVAKLRLKK